MAKMMVLKKGEPMQLIDLPAELVGTPEAPDYRPAKGKKASGASVSLDPKPVETESVDDLDDLDEAALRTRYEEVVGSKAGNRSLDTMRQAIREELAGGAEG